MVSDKNFKSYNQQMRKLRDKKKIECGGSKDKCILAKTGYFNLINGYKGPFTCGTDTNGDHIYLPNTRLDNIYSLKIFDDDLRLLLLKYITKVEEEVRTLTGYKFDQCNNDGKIPWFETSAYSEKKRMQDRMGVISSAYSELSKSQLDYVKFYMDKHTSIPTWIMIKVVNFSTFINILDNSKTEVIHSICKLYDITEPDGHYNVKLLIGSLNWFRKVRNACAHNERIYCINYSGAKGHNAGRIIERYFNLMKKTYSRVHEKRIMDLLIYMKYYLQDDEFKKMITEIQSMMVELQSSISNNAFDNIRGQMGIKKMEDLEELKNFPKKPILYNKFDTY